MCLNLRFDFSFFHLLFMKFLLLMLSEEPFRVMIVCEYVVSRVELDIRHLYHDLQLLFLKDFFHVWNLGLTNLSRFIMILNDLLRYQVPNFPIVQF